MSYNKEGKYDQSAATRKISRETFIDLDLRTRVSGNKKAYNRKQKHKKPLEDY